MNDAFTQQASETLRQIELRHALYDYFTDLFVVAPGHYEPQDIDNLIEQSVSAVGEVAAAYKRIKERA